MCLIQVTYSRYLTQIDTKIRSELHQDALGFLQKYLQEAGITLR